MKWYAAGPWGEGRGGGGDSQRAGGGVGEAGVGK